MQSEKDNSFTIKELRLSLRLTQEKFATKVGVSVNTVRDWELGHKMISISNCEKVERLFKVKLKYYHS